MRIVFLHMTMGLVHRGSEISTDLIAGELAHRHKVLVIQSGPVEPRPYSVKRVRPLKEAPSPSPQNLVDKILFRLKINRSSLLVYQFTQDSLSVISKFKPDIIVTTNGSIQSKIIAHKHPTTKLVVFGRAGIGHDDAANLRAKPDLFVALSETALSWAQKIAPAKTKVVYIPNPLAPTKKIKLNLNLPSPVVLTVAALSKYKNVVNVLEAMKQIPASYLLVGDGEEEAQITQSMRSLPNDFRWIKHLEPHELTSYYPAADVFCFIPDEQEAFGRVYLEAMAAGLPIVASADPVRHSIIGPLGIYVNPKDQDAIVAGISKALRLGKMDYTEQLKQYSLKKVVKQIDKEFHDLIS